MVNILSAWGRGKVATYVKGSIAIGKCISSIVQRTYRRPIDIVPFGYVVELATGVKFIVIKTKCLNPSANTNAFVTHHTLPRFAIPAQHFTELSSGINTIFVNGKGTHIIADSAAQSIPGGIIPDSNIPDTSSIGHSEFTACNKGSFIHSQRVNWAIERAYLVPCSVVPIHKPVNSISTCFFGNTCIEFVLKYSQCSYLPRKIGIGGMPCL